MKIMLVCYGGLSTSILVNNMQKAINESEKFKDRGIIIEAWGKDEYLRELDDVGVILLGPQVSMIEEQVKTDIQKEGVDVPVLVMNKDDYGMMNATPILITAFKAMKQHREMRG